MTITTGVELTGGGARAVLVTGGAGFIGSRLCSRLVELGHRVTALDNYFAGTRDAHVDGVSYLDGHTGDVASLVTDKPEIIFHLGEYSRVERSLEEPAVVWDLNVRGTFGVIEYWRQIGCKLVYAGSSTKFADGGLGRDQSPYAFTKATNSELVRNYADWFGLPYAITYFYNVYGPGERAGRYGTVIEIFRQKAARGEPLTVTAPGTQRRIFTHVDDIVDGLLTVAERGEGDEFGLGASESFSVLDVAHLFGSEVIMTPEVAGNRMSAKLDVTRARALGWAPQRKLTDYIETVRPAST